MTSPGNGDGNGSPEVMIDVRHLTRYYGPVPALDDVSFQARRGEIVGFLGPNGAGKTTAMRILTGFMPPSAGQALVAGYDVVEQSLQARRATGYLPESAPLYADMTVYGYLDFMAKLRGVADRRDEVERVMARVSIDHRADDLISQLSKGLRQRVGIAQALVHNPPVIILDEPTIGLDPQQIREVRGLVRELGGDHTIILSTHILSEAEQICDRVLIINSGRIVAADALERLAQRGHGGEIRLVVGADVDDAAVGAWLTAVEGVTEVSVEGDGRFRLGADRERETRARIAGAVIQRGWQLYELTAVELTLEDIFLQVTASEPAAPHGEGPGDGPDADEAAEAGTWDDGLAEDEAAEAGTWDDGLDEDAAGGDGHEDDTAHPETEGSAGDEEEDGDA